MEAFGLSLIAMFGWGMGDYYSSKMSRYNPFVVSAFAGLLGGFAGLALIAVYGWPDINLTTLAWIIMAGFTLNLAVVVFYLSFRKNDVGVASAIGNTYPLVTALGSWLIYGAVLSSLGWLGLGVTVVGVALTSVPLVKRGAERPKLGNVGLSLVAMLMFGIGFMFLDKASGLEWYESTAVFELTYALVAGVIALASRRSRLLTEVAEVAKRPEVFYLSVLAVAGTFGFFAAVGAGGSSTIPVIVASASVMVTSLAAKILDKESLSLSQYGGIAVIVIGLSLLTLS